jgi:carbonic anhydrase/acetyltransferase-like protein (isoleucine patch superfamily)
VQLRRFSSVWYNAVIRGDINKVEVGPFSVVGENSVLLTAPSLPTGMHAKLLIGMNTVIGSNCVLYSCHIGDDVAIGDKCVILEGARIENAAQIAAGSVVPPGRLIPTKQLWGGNPCSFIKDLNIAETWSNYTMSYVHNFLADTHKNEFSPWGNAYL